MRLRLRIRLGLGVGLGVRPALGDVVHSSYLGEAADNVRVADARGEDATLLKAWHAPQLKRTVVTRGYQHWLTGRSLLARLVREEQRGDARRLVVPGGQTQ